MLRKMIGIKPELLSSLKTKFLNTPEQVLAQNVCSNKSFLEVIQSADRTNESSYVFNYRVDKEVGPISSQHSSGRCWIFACLNLLRIPFCKKLGLDSFEFSQSHIYYWNKLEKGYFMLEAFWECAKRNEDPTDRLVSFLLAKPNEDGGQWDMLVNLIEKYGVMPKSLCPDRYSAKASLQLNRLMDSKAREFCKRIFDLHKSGVSDEEMRSQIDGMFSELFRIVNVTLGSPPETFTWEYLDRDKTYQKIGPISSLEFYQKHVKPVCDVSQKVCLVEDPRPGHDFYSTLTVEFLGNMAGGKKVIYSNFPISVLKELAIKSLKENEPVWFGCDSRKHLARESGIFDTEIHNFKLAFGIEMMALNKSERLTFGESMMTHAMLFTGVSLDDDGKPTKWRVENSWGDKSGEKGYYMLTDDWFTEFVLEVAIDRKFLTDDVAKVLDKEPKVLPAWDPLGSLA